MSSAGNAFVVSLALADLVVAIYPYPLVLTAIFNDGWIAGYIHCQISGFLMGLSVIGSIFNITGIAINRYCYICHSLKYDKLFSNSNTMCYVVLVWALTILAIVPNWFVESLQYDPRVYSCTFAQSVSSLYTIAVVVVHFILPIGIVTYCYLRIWILVIRVRRRVKPDSRSKIKPHDLRNFLTMFVVFVLFAVCWAPLNLIGLAVALDPRLSRAIPENHISNLTVVRCFVLWPRELHTSKHHRTSSVDDDDVCSTRSLSLDEGVFLCFVYLHCYIRVVRRDICVIRSYIRVIRRDIRVIRRIFVLFEGYSCYSKDIRVIRRIFVLFEGYSCYSKDIRVIRRIFVLFEGYSCYSKDIRVIRRIFVLFEGYSCYSKDIRVIRRIFVLFEGYSCYSKDIRVIRRIFVLFEGYSCYSKDIRVIRRIFVLFEGYSCYSKDIRVIRRIFVLFEGYSCYSKDIRVIRRIFVLFEGYSCYSKDIRVIRRIFVLFEGYSCYSKDIRVIRRIFVLFEGYSCYSKDIRVIRRIFVLFEGYSCYSKDIRVIRRDICVI
ncbi:hypothetical protein F2P81_008436 [Scophthalmus maximus]|uniref:G-protein coupled receptors family 1 profile domain-containing protein n=1 Tax=Scophthalmus maximus TaxID=52904 RepID=A0A6A4TBB0_SCOMX|nr:hypothetical protein F2P81_008436 [Scophthalmus maximus]